jgi:outer membrane protein
MRQVPLALALCTLAIAPGELGAQVRSITLADAIRLSERVQPGVVRAAGDVTTAAAQRRSTWGAYLPSVTATSSASDFFSEGPSRVDPITGQVIDGNTTNRSVSTSLSASMDLFTGFRRGAENRAAKAGQAAAEASLIDARFQQALTTTNQFFNALAAAQLVKVRQASVRRAEEQLKVSVNKLLAGSATRSDTLRSRVTLGSANLDLIQAGTALATAEAELARLVGQTGRIQAADDSAFYQVVAPLDTVAVRTEAEGQSPLVRSTVAQADAARAGLSAAKSAYWPSLTLGAGTSWNATGANDYDLLNQRQLTLGLRWNLFDRFDRELSIAQQSMWPMPPRPTPAARSPPSSPRRWPSSTTPAPRSTSLRPAWSRPPRTSGSSRSATGWARPPSSTCSAPRKRSTRRRSTWWSPASPTCAPRPRSRR